MSAMFGIEANEATVPAGQHMICMRRTATDGTVVPHALHHVSSEDIVFLKHYSAQSGLEVTALGVVQSGHPRQDRAGICLPVSWVWRGSRHIENPEEVNNLRGKSLYEEYDIEVQRELLELLPQDFQLAQEW